MSKSSSGRLSALILGACFTPSSGCVETEPLDRLIGPRDIVVWAAGSGRLERAGVLVSGGRAATRVVPRDAVMWMVAADRIVRADGGEIDDVWLETLRVVPRGDPGGCGRCTGSKHGEPLLVFPGDRCPLPTFAVEIRGEPEDAARLAREIEIAWPGECTCQREAAFSDGAPPPWLWRINRNEPTPSDLLAAEPNGGLAGVSGLGIWVRAPDGTMRTLESEPSCGVEPPPGTFDGVLRSAALNRRGELVVAEQPAISSPQNRISVHTFGQDLGQRETLELTWNVTSVSFPSALGGDQLIIAGFESRDDGDAARMLVCDLERSSPGRAPILDCREVVIPGELRAARGIRAIAEYEGQILFLLESPIPNEPAESFLLLAAQPGSPWSFRTIRGPFIDSPAELGFTGALKIQSSLLIRGRHISVCAGSDFLLAPGHMSRFGFVLDAELPLALTEPRTNLDWTLRSRLLHQCDSFIPGPGQSSRTISLEGEQPYLASSNPSDNGPLPLGYRGLPLALAYEPETKRSYVQNRDGALYVWDAARTSTESYVRLSPEPAIDAEEFCPLERNGSLLALGSGGTLIEIEEPSAPEITRRPVPNIGGLSACVYDARRDRILVAGRQGTEAFVRWLHPESFEPQEVALPAAVQGARFFRAVATEWGSVFLLGADDLVVEVSAQGAQVLSLDWDDPETSARETAPDLGCCRAPSPTGPVDIPFNGIERPVSRLTDIDAHQGAVWISARGRGFLRGFPGRLERVAFEDTYLDPPVIRADCGDVAITGQAGVGPLLERGDLRGLERRRDEPLEAWKLFDAPGRSGFGSGTPVQILGTNGRLFVLFGRTNSGQGSLQTLGTLERRSVAGPLLRGAATAAGHLLLAGAGGQLYLGTDCR